MANPDRQGKPKIHRSEQDIVNSGFDELFQVPTVELLAYNSSGNTLDRVQINAQGQLLTGSPQIITEDYDYISYTNTSSTVDTYTYKSGGSGGTTVATLTITYTDTSKNQVSSIART